MGKERAVDLRVGPKYSGLCQRGEISIKSQSISRTGLLKQGQSSEAKTTREAYLTFDDGPDPVWTPRVLEALRRADALATFFVIPSLALEQSELVGAILAAGHRVELHCMRHIRHTELSADEVEAEACQGSLNLRSLGVEPRLWRPPWGVVAPWTWSIAASQRLEIMGWTADTHDWRGDRASSMLDSVEPLLREGSVILMHDGIGPGAFRDGCEETVALVGDLVVRLRQLGLEPAALGGPRGIGDRERATA